MSTRRLEEILEECLSAYLDGRRSVEESLSLYPSYSSDLEPLLRTATGINYALNSFSPPDHVQQRGLQRFLSDARARRNLKGLQFGAIRPGRLAIAWQRYRLGFAGAAMSVLILAAAIGGTALLGDSSGNRTVFPITGDSATPSVVTALQQQVDTVRSRAANRSLTADDIDRLTALTGDLEGASDGEIDSARDSITEALIEANALVAEIIATQDPILSQPAQEAQDKIRDVAADKNIPLSSPTIVATEAPTPTPDPTSVPTEAPTPTPAPTIEPTDEPTPTPPLPTEPPPREPA